MKIIGLSFDAGSQTEYLTSIDPATGAATRTGSGLPGVAFTVQGSEAAKDGKLYFEGLSASYANFLYVADEATGQLLAALPSSAQSLVGDGTTGKLVGLTFDSSSQMEYLTSIDPLTGVAIRVGNGLPGVAGIFQGAEAATGGKLYFEGLSASHAHFLYVADEATGQLLAALPSSSDTLAVDGTSGALVGLAYDAGSKTEFLTSIDPVTGATAQIGNGLPGVAAITSGAQGAVDGKLYFEGRDSSTASFLYIADEATGGLIAALSSAASIFTLDTSLPSSAGAPVLVLPGSGVVAGMVPAGVLDPALTLTGGAGGIASFYGGGDSAAAYAIVPPAVLTFSSDGDASTAMSASAQSITTLPSEGIAPANLDRTAEQPAVTAAIAPAASTRTPEDAAVIAGPTLTSARPTILPTASDARPPAGTASLAPAVTDPASSAGMASSPPGNGLPQLTDGSQTTKAPTPADGAAGPDAVAVGSAAADPASAPLMALELQAPVAGTITADRSSADIGTAMAAGAKLAFLSGVEAVQLTDATLSVGQDTGEATIQRLYEGLLGRGNDTGGISFYDAELIAGASKSAVATQMLASQEYAADAGTQTDGQFVATLYHGLFGRDAAADPNASFWSGRLADGASRGDVASAVADTGEAKAHLAPTTARIYVPHAPGTLAHELYETGLGREVELPALGNFQNAYASLTAAQFAAQIAGSAEFTAGHAGQSNAAYVNSLYQAGLGRPAEAGGSAFWAGLLNGGGASRSDVLLGIATAGEAAAHLTRDLSG